MKTTASLLPLFCSLTHDLSSNATADDLMEDMKQIIERCHESGIKVIGGTITPSEQAGACDSGDHLHPNDAGYNAKGEAVDLALFR